MELKLDISKEQLVQIINQLPDHEIVELLGALKKRNFSTSVNDPDFLKLLENAPTWTDEEYNAYLEGRATFKNSRIAQ